MQYLEIKMGKTHYGIELENIIELLEKIDITQVPVSDEYVMGITNIRDKVMPVYNLAYRLGIHDFEMYTDKKYGNQYLVVEHAGTCVALEITFAKQIREIDDEEIRTLPEGFLPEEPLVKYMVKTEDDLISILDVRKFFNEEINSLMKIGA